MSFIHKTKQHTTNKQWQVESQPIWSLNIHDPKFSTISVIDMLTNYAKIWLHIYH